MRRQKTGTKLIFTRATGNHFMSWQTPDDNQWSMILIFSACGAMGGFPDVGQMLIGGGVSLFVWWALAFVGRNTL